MKDNYVAMSLSVASSPSKNMWAWWGWKMRAGRKRILVSPQPPVWKPKERLATIISFTLVSKVTGQGCKCTRLGKQWSSCKQSQGSLEYFKITLVQQPQIQQKQNAVSIQLPVCVLNCCTASASDGSNRPKCRTDYTAAPHEVEHEQPLLA